MSEVDHSEPIQTGMTRRQMLRAGTVVGATAVWIAPAATVHAMTESLAQATSGETTHTTVREAGETTDTSAQKPNDTPSGGEPDVPETTEKTVTTSPERTETTLDDSPDTAAAETTTETTAGGKATDTSEPTETVQVAATETTAGTDTTDTVTVLGTEITAEAPVAVARPTATPPILAQTELPQTGLDIDILGGIGATLTGLGAAALAATKEPKSD
jgi:hypothetical protein